MYSTHNESNSGDAEKFIKTLKGKFYNKLTANDSKSYLGYLNKSVDQYLIIIVVLLIKNLLILILLVWLKKLNLAIKLENLMLVIKSELLTTKMFLIKIKSDVGPWLYKIKNLNGEKTIPSLYNKQMLLCKL